MTDTAINTSGIIRYRYSCIPRQLLFLSLFVYVLLRLIIIMQILIFRLPGFYEKMNFPLTILLHLALLAAVLFLFFMQRFFFRNMMTRKWCTTTG